VSGHSFRQVVGIVINSIEVYTQVLYFAIEMQNRFENITVGNPTLFTLVFILYNLLRVIVPMAIIIYDVCAVMAVVRRSKAAAEDKRNSSFLDTMHVGKVSGPLAHRAPLEGRSKSTEQEANWAKFLSMRKRRNSVDKSNNMTW
jgi:hypothetical protein